MSHHTYFYIYKITRNPFIERKAFLFLVSNGIFNSIAAIAIVRSTRRNRLVHVHMRIPYLHAISIVSLMNSILD